MNTQDPLDILQWPDRFWCFREELSPKFLRDDNYRVIFCSSDEWLRLISARRPAGSPPPPGTPPPPQPSYEGADDELELEQRELISSTCFHSLRLAAPALRSFSYWS